MPRPSRRDVTALTGLLFISACVVERIDDIIAEHSVTYSSSESSSILDTEMSTGTTGTTTSTDTTESSTSSGNSMGASSDSDTSGDDSSTGATPGPVCGDKIVEGDEECDDGNQQNADNCRNDCTRVWVVFITSEPSIQGDMNGIYGADYQCRHRATNAFLLNGERFKAWISTSTVQPVDRFHHARGPYVLSNGQQIAADWDALTSGTLEHPINRDEYGNIVEIGVWTGTDAAGRRIPNSTFCSDWTYGDSDQTGWVADSTATNSQWTLGVESPCIASGALYCFEQP